MRPRPSPHAAPDPRHLHRGPRPRVRHLPPLRGRVPRPGPADDLDHDEGSPDRERIMVCAFPNDGELWFVKQTVEVEV